LIDKSSTNEVGTCYINNMRFMPSQYIVTSINRFVPAKQSV